MKVYVTQAGEYSDFHYYDIFLSEDKAREYCEVQNKLDPYSDWWYSEEETADDTFKDVVSDVKEFYTCNVELETGDCEDSDKNAEFTTPIINKKESFYEIDTLFNYISGYSTKSYEHAKKIAIEQYQIYTQNKLEQ